MCKIFRSEMNLTHAFSKSRRVHDILTNARSAGAAVVERTTRSFSTVLLSTDVNSELHHRPDNFSQQQQVGGKGGRDELNEWWWSNDALKGMRQL